MCGWEGWAARSQFTLTRLGCSEEENNAPVLAKQAAPTSHHQKLWWERLLVWCPPQRGRRIVTCEILVVCFGVCQVT